MEVAAFFLILIEPLSPQLVHISLGFVKTPVGQGYKVGLGS
jgi:hypothetical protein